MSRSAFAVVLVVALGLSAPGTAAPKSKQPEKALTLEEVNTAAFHPKAKASKGLSPVVLKAQVLLDRARFSPGVIDARGGENTKKALMAFAQAWSQKQWRTQPGRLGEAHRGCW